MHLRPRKVAQLLGEISYLCALGQPSDLLIPTVLERIQLLIPATFYGCAWMDRRGTVQRVYCTQDGVTGRPFQTFAEKVAGQALEAEALVPSRDLILQGIPFANSDSHTRKFHRTFYFNELLRPNGAFHTGRFQILPRKGDVGILFAGRTKPHSAFGTDEGAFYVRFLKPHLEKLFSGDALPARHWLRNEETTGNILATFDGALELYDTTTLQILREVEGYFERHWWKDAALRGDEGVVAVVVARLAEKLREVLAAQDGGPPTETIYLADRRITFLASPLWRDDKMSERHFQVHVRVTSSRQLAWLNRASSLNLSPTEKIVTLHLADGLTYREIGERKRITKGTVETYIKNIFSKLGVRSSAELKHLLEDAGGAFPSELSADS